MDTLLEHLETAKSTYTASNSAPHLVQSILLAWEKLNKYYSMTDANVVLYAAVVLHPALKYDYFEINWAEHPDWIKDAKCKVEALWQHR